MERVVLFGALAFAAVVAAGAIFGVGHPRFDLIAMGPMEALRPVAVGKLASQTFQTGSVSIHDAAVRVIVSPEDRQDVAIEIDNPGHLPMPEVKLTAEGLNLDGHLRGRTRCEDDGGAIVKGYGAFDAEKLPLVTIHTPQTVDFEFAAAGAAAIGAAREVKLSLTGCGAAKVADVAETLTLDIAGASNLEAGTVGALKLKAAGANHARIGVVKNGADVDLAGASDARVARVDGALDYRNAGAGELKVMDGALDSLDVENAGAGRFELAAGTVKTLSVIDGGAGSVKIVGPVGKLKASLAGAGSVVVDGTVGDIDANIAGAGKIKIKAVTGAITKKVLGAGSVTVGR